MFPSSIPLLSTLGRPLSFPVNQAEKQILSAAENARTPHSQRVRGRMLARERRVPLPFQKEKLIIVLRMCDSKRTTDKKYADKYAPIVFLSRQKQRCVCTCCNGNTDPIPYQSFQAASTTLLIPVTVLATGQYLQYN